VATDTSIIYESNLEKLRPRFSRFDIAVDVRNDQENPVRARDNCRKRVSLPKEE
jgi:hypothetical protein